DEQLSCAHPLLHGEEEPFAGRAQCQHAVEPGRREEVHVGPEGVLVQRLAGIAKRSHGGGDRSLQHGTNSKLTEWPASGSTAIDTCPAPVVARVQGYALGGGSGLVACADIAIAAPDATFGFSEVKLGIIPAVISPFVLPRIGAHARRYFLTGERFGAETARRI